VKFITNFARQSPLAFVIICAVLAYLFYRLFVCHWTKESLCPSFGEALTNGLSSLNPFSK